MERRNFLKYASIYGMVGASSLVQGLGAKSAVAANAGGYKALVCVNLKGGMDHADTVVPINNEEYNQLVGVREELLLSYDYTNPLSSRHVDNLLRLGQNGKTWFGGRSFGLPVELKEIHSLFNDGDAAIVANVGPLLEPIDRNSMDAGGKVPARLFSHNDQQSTWQTLSTEGARYGWGGGFVDAANAQDPTGNALFSAMSASELDVFLAGSSTTPFRLPTGNSSQELDVISKRWLLGSNQRFDTARKLLREHLLTTNQKHRSLMQRDIANATQRGVKNRAEYKSYLDMASPLAIDFPASKLGDQLSAVAKTISLRNVMGIPRQVFYVTLKGFDTHDSQSIDLPENHRILSMALDAFKHEMMEQNVWNDVAVFTMSDFGRTLSANGDGTDHGWGSHHFVMGGGVNGGEIHGEIPLPATSSKRFTKRRARMIPTLSIEQYGYHLGRWFGLDDDALYSLFPNLNRFDSAALNLFHS